MIRKARISVATAPQRQGIDTMANQQLVARVAGHSQLSRRRNANDQVFLSGETEHPRLQAGQQKHEQSATRRGVRLL
jgi:hypothetical protein